MVRRRVYCLRYPSTTLPDTHEEKTKFFFISSEQSPKRYTDETAQTLIDTGFEPYLLRKLRFGMFSITVHKYVPGEENDADLLFSGDVISDEFYNMETGQIEEF